MKIKTGFIAFLAMCALYFSTCLSMGDILSSPSRPASGTPASTPSPGTTQTDSAASYEHREEIQSQISYTAFEQRVVELINNERTKAGLSPLRLYDTLSSVARAHSDDMLRNNFVRDTGSDGSTSLERIRQSGITDMNYWNWFISANSDTPDQMVAAWMNSAAHRNIILRENLSYIGVGMVPRPAGSTADRAAYWTIMFIDMPNPRYIFKDSGLDPLPWHFINITWDFRDMPDFQRFDIDVTVTDVSREFNFYISPINASFTTNAQFYAGFQTNTRGWRSKTDRTDITLGKGGIFSRWSIDQITPIGLDYVDMFADGACESAGYEGEFCSVRRPFVWKSGTYTFSLIKEETITYNRAPHTWVAYEITDKSTNETKRIGRLLFEGATLRLNNTNGAFVETYGSTRAVPPATVSFGYPRVNNIELPANRIFAHRPHVTPNVTTVSTSGRNIIVTLDPVNLRPGGISKDYEYINF